MNPYGVPEDDEPTEVMRLGSALKKYKPDPELLKAQQFDTVSQGFGNVSDSLFAAFGGKGGGSNKMPSKVSELNQQRASQSQQAAAEKAAEGDDPNSETSKSSREIARSIAPDFATHVGPQYDRLSHNQLKEYMPVLETLAKRKEEDPETRAAKLALENIRVKEIQHKIDGNPEKDAVGLDLARAQAEAARAAAAAANARANHIKSGGGAPSATGGRKIGQIDNEFELMRKAISSQGGRGSLLPKTQERLNAADRLEALATNGQGIENLTPQQMREASASLASLIAGGSAPTENAVHELTPDTYASQWANLKQKIMNEPKGADAQAFLQNMLATVAREKKVANAQIKAARMQAIPSYAHLRGIDKARFDSMLQANGIDPSSVDEHGLPANAAPAATAAPRRKKMSDGSIWEEQPDGSAKRVQ